MTKKICEIIGCLLIFISTFMIGSLVGEAYGYLSFEYLGGICAILLVLAGEWLCCVFMLDD